MNMKKIAQACAVAGTTLLAGQVYAANWLQLQGTEAPGSAGRAKVWGFIQAQYQKDFSNANPGPGGCPPSVTNCYIPPKLIGPNLTSQSAFNVNRARIGVRGSNFPLDSRTNYFLLVEFGNNGLTNSKDNYAPRVSDASITLNYIPGARVRMGLFKYPGSEEGLQGIGVLDYINFTNVSNQLMLERFQSAHTAVLGADTPPQTLPPSTPLVAFDRPVGGFRDVGIQVFDWFNMGGLEHSYALMIGNGNGVNFTDDNSAKDVYAYWSTAKVFGGRGGRREDLKGFAWYQKGKRTWDDGTGTGSKDYDRKRWGFGVRYLKKPFRATAEYLAGEGMIFNGPDKPNYALGTGGMPCGGGLCSETNATSGLLAKAKGWYVEGGWYIPGTKWELDARYDVYHRLDGSHFQLDWKTTTLGVQYHLNRKTRVTLNYAFNKAEAVDFGSGAGPNGNLDGVDDRVSLQVTSIY